MTYEFLMAISKDVIMTSLYVSAPILIAGLIAGLLISIFQAVTQIHEMTLTFIPKIIACALAGAIFYNFMVEHLVEFTVRMFTIFPSLTK